MHEGDSWTRFLSPKCSWESSPPELRERGRYLLLDTLGAALAGHAAPAANQVRALFPGGREVAPTEAALILGVSAQAVDLDETNLRARCHIAAAVIPALAAASALVQRSGAQFMSALLSAYSFAGLLGESLSANHASRGWHSSSTVGTFGAAYGVSMLLGLDGARLHNAVGIAATQASGVKAVFGGTAKPFNSGRAAQSGLMAAFLARSGMSAPQDPFFSPGSFFAASDSLPFGRFDSSRHPLLDNHFKFLPCCIETHAAAYAAQHLLRDYGRPERLRIELAPTARAMVDRPQPADIDQARFSVQYVASLALAGGGRSPEPSAFQPQLIQSAPPITISEDPGLPHLSARLAGLYGRQEQSRVVDLGSAGPFDPSSLESKFDILARPVLGGDTVMCRREILDLEHAPDVASVLRRYITVICRAPRDTAATSQAGDVVSGVL